MSVPSLSRRRFVQLAIGASAAALAGRSLLRADTSALRPPPSAAGQLRVAVIGLRIKGNQHVDELLKLRDARLIALCDADSAILAATAARLDLAGVKVDTYVDFRRLLERPDLDAVVIATPNHLHTLLTLWAVQAGKDVYVEKPVSHTIHEGRILAAAAGYHGRLIQAGTQKRSDAGLQEAIAELHRGALGRITLARGFCYRRREPIGLSDRPAPVPDTLDLDLFCGPAALSVPHRPRFHYDWHWFWETGNGEIGNQGPHELDLCRLALGESGRPRRVLSLGGRFGPADSGETPNTHLTWFDFPTAPLLFEVRGLPRTAGGQAEDAFRGVRVGIVIECEGGSLIAGSGGATFLDPQGKRLRQFPGDAGGGHLQNFVDAALARDASRLAAPIAGAAISNDLVHFGNLAYRTGAPLAPEALAERLSGHPAAASAFAQLQEHLAANTVAGQPTPPWRLGGWLEWDDAARRFSSGANHDAANLLLTRSYRAPWSLPVLT